jgi:hypothetical protein
MGCAEPHRFRRAPGPVIFQGKEEWKRVTNNQEKRGKVIERLRKLREETISSKIA